jgi:ferredoxin-NADP reductase/MOSC domain-containing protein YiiM
MSMARLRSVNVGLPKEVEWRGKRVYTGIWKTAVEGERVVRRLNVDGDGQGDLAGHGGEHRAVFVYQTAAYDYWAQVLRRTDFVMGQFGENFTVDGLPDNEVRIGDRYQIGTALFEVTQPRVTCYRVGIRMNDPQMPALLVSHSKPGFYFRVLEEGAVRAGDAIELVSRHDESMTVADIDALLYRPGHDPEQLRRALEIPALSAGWRASFHALLERGDDASGNPGLAPGDVARAAWTGFRPARFATIAHETADVLSVEVEAADAQRLDVAQPGQFVVLRTRPSLETSAIMRSFSICGMPTPARYQLGIKSEPNGVMSRYLSREAHVGDPLEVSAPRGSFVLNEADEPVVLISAGIGITPVLAMLRALAARRSQRTIWWLYGARSGAEHPFANEVRELVRELGGATAHVRYSRPGEGDRLGRDFDSIGHLDAALISRLGIEMRSQFYLCGPAGFLQDLRIGLSSLGVTADRLHSEVFGSGPSVTPGIVDAQRRVPHEPDGAAGDGPVISFARTGLATRWRTGFASLLDLAEACDVPVRWSCRTGVCHTCETGMISGSVRYDPEPIEPPANGNVLLCCSTPREEIALDL